jgi:hypothetical protein
MEAEYQACGAAAREALALLKALGELASLSGAFPLQLVGPVLISCDIKAALSLCQDQKEGKRVKHIDIIHHFAKHHVANGKLKFVYCKSEDNVSDCFTKGLPRFLGLAPGTHFCANKVHSITYTYKILICSVLVSETLGLHYEVARIRNTMATTGFAFTSASITHWHNFQEEIFLDCGSASGIWQRKT